MQRSQRSIAAVIACVAAVSLGAGSASAAPKGNDNWLRFDGTCNGQPFQFLDPPGPGPSNFVIGGTVGVGMRFRSTNLATGEVLEEIVYGRGVDESRLTHCSTVFHDVPTPGGTVDVLFEVWGLVTPQAR